MELVGSYVQSESDGTSARSLTLLSNRTYFGAWDTDIGNAGKVSGTWRLNAAQLVLSASPSTNAGIMEGYLRVLDVYRFKTNWFFVRAEERKHYSKYGIDGLFLFQKDHQRK
jgi:hypothetical protein